MDIFTALSRAKRGLRDELSLHIITVMSLIVAFLCLGVTLLTLTNLSRVTERWKQTQHVSVYLVDNSNASDIAQLKFLLESLPEVRKIEYLDSQTARKEFLDQYENLSDLEALPSEVFPTSLEITLIDGVAESRLVEIAHRLQEFAQVQEVETYNDWFKQLGSMLSAGQWAALVLTFLVAICVVAVIGNTIRLAIANRSVEIEVLKLCGATDGYVRMPFIVEGSLQGLVAALLSILLLLIVYALLQGRIDAAFSTLTGVSISFLTPMTSLSIILGGAAAGALGSLLSLRQYLTI